MPIHEKIERLRRARGLSQEQLAEKLGVSRQSVSKWESAQSMPEVEKIILLSELFGVSTDYLLKEKETASGDRTDNAVSADGPVVDNAKAWYGGMTARILHAASVFFVLIGLLLACGGWYDQQDAQSIAGGLIVQALGVTALLVARALAPQERVRGGIRAANYLLLTFMPVSLFANRAVGALTAPYPMMLPVMALFGVVYLFVALGGWAFFAWRDERHKGGAEESGDDRSGV